MNETYITIPARSIDMPNGKKYLAKANRLIEISRHRLEKSQKGYIGKSENLTENLTNNIQEDRLMKSVRYWSAVQSALEDGFEIQIAISWFEILSVASEKPLNEEEKE